MGVGDCRLGSEIRYSRPVCQNRGSKIVQLKKKGRARADMDNVASAAVTHRLSGEYLRQQWEEWEALGVTSIWDASQPVIPIKPLCRVTGQSGPVSLRRSLIALDLLHLMMAGERISVVSQQASLCGLRSRRCGRYIRKCWSPNRPTSGFCKNKTKKNILRGFKVRP